MLVKIPFAVNEVNGTTAYSYELSTDLFRLVYKSNSLNMVIGQVADDLTLPSSVNPITSVALEQLIQSEAVPQEVTKMQGRVAMARAGILATVDAQMNALPVDDELRVVWETANSFKRSHYSIEVIKVAIGLTDAQIDDMFRVAGTIE